MSTKDTSPELTPTSHSPPQTTPTSISTQIPLDSDLITGGQHNDSYSDNVLRMFYNQNYSCHGYQCDHEECSNNMNDITANIHELHIGGNITSLPLISEGISNIFHTLTNIVVTLWAVKVIDGVIEQAKTMASGQPMTGANISNSGLSNNHWVGDEPQEDNHDDIHAGCFWHQLRLQFSNFSSLVVVNVLD